MSKCNERREKKVIFVKIKKDIVKPSRKPAKILRKLEKQNVHNEELKKLL